MSIHTCTGVQSEEETAPPTPEADTFCPIGSASGSSTRRCPRCSEVKPVSSGFYAGKNGRPSVYCCDCSRARSRDYKRSDRGQRLSCEYMRRYADANRDRVRSVDARMRQKHPMHKAARRAANYAIGTGRLTRPACCEICATDPGVDRRGRTLLRADHHRGYDREHWLDVRFICPTCDGLQIRAQNDARRAALLTTLTLGASASAEAS